MILNSPGYTYDVHSLVKAFYPAEDVSVVSDAPVDPGAECISVFVSSGDVKDDVKVSGFIRVTAPVTGKTETCEEEYSDIERSQLKSLLKRVLYGILVRMTEKELPWGTMTGIRPTKVATALISQGESDAAIADHMRSVYLCSDEKIKLATAIAHTEKEIIDSLPDNGFSIYIGIPFCPSTCMYCSFTSYPIASWEKRTDDYLFALKKEIDYFSNVYRGRCPDSIYIGGGTPTTLSAAQLKDLTEYIRKSFDLSHLREFTVEAGRPDSITTDKLKVLREAGVGRISINPQTMNEKTLRLIGRRHSVKDVYVAYDKAVDAGFTNINMDLILGLPGENEDDVKYTFDKITEFSPASITVHSMAIKRAAAMSEFLASHGNITSRNTPEMMRIADESARSLGLIPYYLYRQKNMAGNFENVGYAKPGNYGIYNIVIMEEISDIAAAGAGCISKRVFADGRIERCANVKDVAMYIDRIDEMIDKKRILFEQ